MHGVPNYYISAGFDPSGFQSLSFFLFFSFLFILFCFCFDFGSALWKPKGDVPKRHYYVSFQISMVDKSGQCLGKLVRGVC